MIKQLLVLCLSVFVVLFTFILVILYVPKLGSGTNNSFTTYLPILVAFALPFILPRNNNKLVSNVNSTRLDLQFI